jgi:predicted GIY-YIG superfamily endonuclease
MSTHALYRHYDADLRLLYVGITNNPGRRWEQHRDKEWWEEVANTKIERYPDRESVLQAERRAIETERPWWNIIGNGEVLEYRTRLEEAAAAVGQAWFREGMSEGFIRGLIPSCREAFLWARDAQFHDYTLSAEPAGWKPMHERIREFYRAGSSESHWATHGTHAAQILYVTSDEHEVEFIDLKREASFVESDLEGRF